MKGGGGKGEKCVFGGVCECVGICSTLWHIFHFCLLLPVLAYPSLSWGLFCTELPPSLPLPPLPRLASPALHACISIVSEQCYPFGCATDFDSCHLTRTRPLARPLLLLLLLFFLHSVLFMRLAWPRQFKIKPIDQVGQFLETLD